ncbi:hypothetical protein FJQ54_05080 [Sandaracinobacter neustonicus]|uniref:Uncharacterized protein n=1 Tax=Sandaracinobacter neustonicus TaxID=1715348 RepID=A0A501XRC7_9SPHN|nr:hypothetical protein [Sandaracinobacter neustonicus]TPE62893.1 hypothetical protein FJQ54_05080 [Sandaracinobacter neustonicus]
MSNVPPQILKLRKPPAVHNWVRSISKRKDQIAKELFDLAMFGPRHSLQLVTDVLRQVVVDGIDDMTAKGCISNIRSPLVRRLGHEIIEAALPYIRQKDWRGVQVFDGTVEYYPVSANVSVPIRPSFVINDNGKLKIYFIICWARFSLDLYQRRIIATLITEALLSREEFQSAEVKILCIPRHKFSKSERDIFELSISSYELLSEKEKTQLFERYGAALTDAEKKILEALG